MIKIIEKKKNKKVFLKIDHLKSNSEQAIGFALYEIGRENVIHMRVLFKQPKTGRLYTIRGQVHQASAPGEAPARVSGALSRTANYIVRGYHQVEFGDKKPYGLYLERGTRNMAARPHVEQTVKDKAKDTMATLVSYTDRMVLS